MVTRCKWCGSNTHWVGSAGAACFQHIRADERAKWIEWLDSFPWKGPGSIHLGEIMDCMRRNERLRGPLPKPPKKGGDK